MILGLSGFYFYLSRQQTFYSTMNIEYLNHAASEGLTPSGNELNPDEIRAATIVSSALENAGFDINVDYIRNSLSVKGMLTEEEENRKKALLEKGEEYILNPTNYQVQLTLNSNYSDETAQSILTAVVNQYMTWYGNQYVITRAKPGALDDDLLDKYDYIIAMNMISQSIDKMLDYIYTEPKNRYGELFSRDDIIINEPIGDDDRIGWKNVRHICVKRYGNEVYDIPQCIGMCSY